MAEARSNATLPLPFTLSVNLVSFALPLSATVCSVKRRAPIPVGDVGLSITTLLFEESYATPPVLTVLASKVPPAAALLPVKKSPLTSIFAPFALVNDKPSVFVPDLTTPTVTVSIPENAPIEFSFPWISSASRDIV